MTKKLTFAFVIAAFVAARVRPGQGQATAEKKAPPAHGAQDRRGHVARGQADAQLRLAGLEGRVQGQGEPKAGFVWRFGNNEPTTAHADLRASSPPRARFRRASTRVALQPGADNKWDLLFYEAQTFYDKAFKTWEIKARARSRSSRRPTTNFTLKFDGKNMIVEFGPMSSTWTLKPIKVNPPIETEFADVGDEVRGPGAPARGRDVQGHDSSASSTAAQERREGPLPHEAHRRWRQGHAELRQRARRDSSEGEGALEDIVEAHRRRCSRRTRSGRRWPSRSSPGFKKRSRTIDAMRSSYERLKPTATVDGTVTKRDTPGDRARRCAHDRPMRRDRPQARASRTRTPRSRSSRASSS